MGEAIATASTLVFLFLSGLHFYWAIFGIARPELVLPTISSEEKVKLPSRLMTLIVAIGLLLSAAIFADKVLRLWNFSWLGHLRIAMGILFIVRAIGDFKYVGFFKSIKETPFAKMDTKYYSPLCAILGIFILLGEFLT